MKFNKIFFLLIILKLICVDKTSCIIQLQHEPKELYFGRNETSLKAIKSQMNIFALQAILSNFLDQLTILNHHVNLGLVTEHVTELKNIIESSDLSEEGIEEFREIIIELLETNQIIKSWEHFRSHIILDYSPFVKEYLKMQFFDFNKLMYNIKDRKSFIKIVNIFRSINARKFDIIAIFMYWYDATTFYRNNLLAAALIKKAIYERLILEKPHWSSIFVDKYIY